MRAGTSRRAVGKAAAALCVTVLVAVGCAGEGAEEDGTEPVDTAPEPVAAVADACVPVEPGLAADASLAGMPGDYQLTLARSDDDAMTADGTLTLVQMPEALMEMAGAATPLGGVTDIEVEAVGALRIGDLGSTDPAAPGVLVIEMRGPSIILRMGSESNRRDQVAFDGGYTVLTVHTIGTDGFDGSWRSGSQGSTATGHFCARVAEG